MARHLRRRPRRRAAAGRPCSREAGLEPGDAVAFQLPNWREAVVAFYGLAMGGYVLVPIVHIYGAEGSALHPRPERRPRLRLGRPLRPRRLPRHRRRRRARRARRPRAARRGRRRRRPRRPTHVRTRRRGTRSDARDARRRRSHAADPDDVCVLAYTSGTTSDPKGVMHTHRTLLAELAHIGRGSRPGRRTSWAPRSPTRPACSARCSRRWSSARTSISSIAGIPTACSTSCSRPTSARAPVRRCSSRACSTTPASRPSTRRRIRRVGLGGAPVPVALARARRRARHRARSARTDRPNIRRSPAARSTIRPRSGTAPTARR